MGMFPVLSYDGFSGCPLDSSYYAICCQERLFLNHDHPAIRLLMFIGASKRHPTKAKYLKVPCEY